MTMPFRINVRQIRKFSTKISGDSGDGLAPSDIKSVREAGYQTVYLASLYVCHIGSSTLMGAHAAPFSNVQ